MSENWLDQPPRLDELDALPREVESPAALEGRVVAALGQAGLLGRRVSGRPALRAAALAVLAVGLFGAGWLAGGAGGGPPPEAPPNLPPAAAQPPRPTHLLLIRAGSGYRPAATEEGALERVAEYRAWAQQEGRAGRMVAGYKLADGAHLLTAEKVLAPDADVQGLFLIAAESLDAAEEIARRCPHLGYGGTIELRPIDPT